MFVKQRHPECSDCKFFNAHTVSRRCLSCGVGEFFEEKFRDKAPDDDELMRIYIEMSEYYDEE